MGVLTLSVILPWCAHRGWFGFGHEDLAGLLVRDIHGSDEAFSPAHGIFKSFVVCELVLIPARNKYWRGRVGTVLRLANRAADERKKGEEERKARHAGQ